MDTKDSIAASTGNVFEDLGLPDAGDRLAKAELARQIGTIIRERGLTQQAAAHILGVDQPKVSALLAGQLSGFSLERLTRFLTLLGRDVQIVVREASPPNQTGPLSVISA
jgi:predicted XRE-type DNA-binding protein